MESNPRSPELLVDIDLQRKITLIKAIIIVAVIVLVPLGIFAINNKNLVIGVLDFVFAGILLILLNFFVKIEYFTQASHAGVFIAGFFFLFLFMYKSCINAGHFWSFSFPLFSFFLLGVKRGLWASLLLLSAIILYLLFQYRLPFGFEPYSFGFSARLVLAYLLIVTYAYIFENLREKGIAKLFLKTEELNHVVDQLKAKENELRVAHDDLETRILKLKESETALKESEQHLNRAQRIAKMGCWYYDWATETQIWSDECFNLYGVKKNDYPDNIVPESLARKIHKI